MSLIKSNPFQPGSPVPPGIFAGRYSELEQIFKCIAQTEDGTPSNVMISGERGIGKTSLGHFTKALADKDIEWGQGNDRPRQEFVTAYVSVQKNMPPAMVVTQVIQELEQSFSTGKIEDGLKSFIDKFQEVKIAGTGFTLKGSEEVSKETIYNEAQKSLRKYAKKCSEQKPIPKPICIVIDELDRMVDFDGFSSFWKVLQEKLASDNCRNLMLVIIGMPEMKDGLVQDHESFLRTLTPISLDRMNDEEARQIILKALNRGAPPKTISEEALNRILFYSENFPHLLQELGYSAFEVSKGEEIQIDDVEQGLHGNGTYRGSIARLGELFFSRMYDEIRKSENYTELLRIIAELSGIDQRWVARQEILEKFSKKKTSLDSSLKQLQVKNLITRNADKSGEYKLVSKMFQVYVSKILSQEN